MTTPYDSLVEPYGYLLSVSSRMGNELYFDNMLIRCDPSEWIVAQAKKAREYRVSNLYYALGPTYKALVQSWPLTEDQYTLLLTALYDDTPVP